MLVWAIIKCGNFPKGFLKLFLQCNFSWVNCLQLWRCQLNWVSLMLWVPSELSLFILHCKNAVLGRMQFSLFCILVQDAVFLVLQYLWPLTMEQVKCSWLRKQFTEPVLKFLLQLIEWDVRAQFITRCGPEQNNKRHRKISEKILKKQINWREQ